VPIYMNVNPMSLNFRPTGAVVPVYVPEVKGFEAAAEPTQADADTVATALAALYAELTGGQRAVIDQILAQAAEVSAVSTS
jgi:hypothetical protein